MAEMTEYLDEHIKRVKRQPREDILSKLTQLLENPRHLVGMSILILAAGNETTTNLLAHGLQELLRHPQQLALLRKHPELIHSAVEEMLRYRGTIRKQDRIATVDTEIDGVRINKGDSIALWNASQPRPDGDRSSRKFDITRTPNRHLALGAGPPCASATRLPASRCGLPIASSSSGQNTSSSPAATIPTRAWATAFWKARNA